MNTQDKIKEIRKWAIKANPEIVELKFGCEYIGNFGDKYLYVRKIKDISYGLLYRHGHYGNVLYQYPIKDIEIIGRPIGIADILLAITNKHECMKDYTTNTKGFLFFNSTISWNLKETLENQLPATIDFIYSLKEK